MMYNEFLELSGKSESYISYKEYTEEIEPIYMACDLPTKEDFIKAFNETFERIVYPIVENTISNFSTEEKLAYLYSFRREEMDESVRMFDRKARQIAYDYMKLYLMVVQCRSALWLVCDFRIVCYLLCEFVFCHIRDNFMFQSFKLVLCLFL